MLRSSLKKIKETNKIIASDQDRVFAVSANKKLGSPRDIERKLGIKRGKGEAFVEFDADPSEFERRFNPLTKQEEIVFKGDIDLTKRNPTFH